MDCPKTNLPCASSENCEMQKSLTESGQNDRVLEIARSVYAHHPDAAVKIRGYCMLARMEGLYEARGINDGFLGLMIDDLLEATRVAKALGTTGPDLTNT